MDDYSALLDTFPSDSSALEQKKGRWTREEDDLLRQAVEELGDKQWSTVAQRVSGRSSVQCLHRWTKILKPGLVKGPWSAAEDLKLLEWVESEGPIKWTACAENIPGRSGKQCKERWANTLDPDVKKGNWQDEEDKTIFRLFHKIGPKWTEMTNYLPGRTENSIKNRFYSTIRKAKHIKQTPLVCRSALQKPSPVPSPSVTNQLIGLLQQVQKLELLLGKTKQQINYLEESIEFEDQEGRELEEITQEVLF